MLLFRKSLFLASLLFTSAIGFSQVTEKWVKRQNGEGDPTDMANALVVDRNGHVIVTGLCDGDWDVTANNSNWATIKYNTDGSIKWLNRYNGPGNGKDEATAIATDSRGYIYVTGWSTGNGTDQDFTTIKYSEDGDTIWVRRYNGPANSSDRVRAIAVDEDGNVYVTGISTGMGTGGDITTIKYDNEGDTIWVRRYNGPGNAFDEASAIAVDNHGNVYVTGTSTGSGTRGDITTIKYDADGDLEWVNRYNGPINKFDGAKGLALDHNGNVYITGLINVSEFDETNVVTIKYNASGLQQWAAIYSGGWFDEATAIGVDASGNAYITMRSGPPDDDSDNNLRTIKYNTAGILQWEAIYDGPDGQLGGFPTNLVLDTAGNVYITGGISIRHEIDYATIKYNTNGVQQWIATYEGPGNDFDRASAIGVDKDGNVYITGRSKIHTSQNYDYATIKYNADGVRNWVERFNGVSDLVKGEPDGAVALALDKDGNVHVTGSIIKHNTRSDYTTYKYDQDANRIWKKTYHNTGFSSENANAIVVNANGNVYVTGVSEGGASGVDYATLKYDKAGNTKWLKRYNGPGNSFDQARAIAVDNAGNVYVTGTSYGDSSRNDYATIKYDSNGNTKWVQRYDGTGKDADQAVAIAVDNAGNVYVTGTSWGNGSLKDYVTIKYDANGNRKWVLRYNGPANSTDEAMALVVDASGNVYVTGGSSLSSGTSYFTTVKYNTAGVRLWVARYEGSGSGFEAARDIAVDASGNVYVTGGSLGDYTTIKYNPAGVQQWVAKYDGGHSDGSNALAVDSLGNVYVTGASGAGSSSFPDYATVKYDTAGVQLWVARYDGPAGGSDAATDIAVDDDGHVYVTGSSEGIGTSSDYATIKYEQTPLITTRSAIHPVQNNLVVEERGSAKLSAKAFPNAFTQFINLQWSGSDKPVTINITDMLGKLVEKRTGLASSGTIMTGHNFKPGVYFAEIVQGAEKVVVRLIKN